MNFRSLGRLLTTRTRTVLAGMLVALLLAPVPGYAFTFLGSWAFTTERNGGPPFATTSSSDTPAGGLLTIDMQQYSAQKEASSQIVAKRSFDLGPSGETIDVRHQFETLLNRGDVKVAIKVKKRNSNEEAFKFPVFTQAVGQTDTLVGTDDLFSQFFASGEYKLIVKITYTKKTKGLWDNTPPPAGSPHRFTFSGV